MSVYEKCGPERRIAAELKARCLAVIAYAIDWDDEEATAAKLGMKPSGMARLANTPEWDLRVAVRVAAALDVSATFAVFPAAIEAVVGQLTVDQRRHLAAAATAIDYPARTMMFLALGADGREKLIRAGAAVYDLGVFSLTDPFGWEVAHACAWEIGESRMSLTQFASGSTG